MLCSCSMLASHTAAHQLRVQAMPNPFHSSSNLHVTVSDPRHHCGTVSLLPKLCDHGSSSRSSPTLPCQAKPLKQGKQHHCEAVSSDGHPVQTCPKGPCTNAVLEKGAYPSLHSNLKLGARLWVDPRDKASSASTHSQNELWHL